MKIISAFAFAAGLGWLLGIAGASDCGIIGMAQIIAMSACALTITYLGWRGVKDD